MFFTKKKKYGIYYLLKKTGKYQNVFFSGLPNVFSWFLKIHIFGFIFSLKISSRLKTVLNSIKYIGKIL